MIFFILTAAVSSLILLDTTYVGQFMLSEPIFMLPLLGVMRGRLPEALQAGLNMEFIFLGRLAVGASTPPFAGFAAAVFWSSVVLGDSFTVLSLVTVFVLSIPAGYWGREVDVFIRKLNADVSEHGFEMLASSGSFHKITSGVAVSILVFFVINFLNIALLAFGVHKVGQIAEPLLSQLLSSGYILMLWRYFPLIGVLFLLDRFNDRRNNGYFILGIIGGLLAGVIYWTAS